MSMRNRIRLPDASTCIAICSAKGARFWHSESRDSGLSLLKEIQHWPGMERNAEFASDKPGRSFDSQGRGRHAMSKEHSAKEQSVLGFVDNAAEYLNGLVYAGDVRYLVLFADPKVLGALRKKLSPAARQATVHEEPKNLANFDTAMVKDIFK